MMQDLFRCVSDGLWLLIADFHVVITKRRESAASSQVDALQWKRIPYPHMASRLIEAGAEDITTNPMDKIETLID